MHKAKKKTISTYHKKNHTKMSNNASKYSAEDEPLKFLHAVNPYYFIVRHFFLPN